MSPIVHYEGWLELVEIVPPSILDELVPTSSTPSTSPTGHRTVHALILSFGRGSKKCDDDDGGSDDLISVVVQGIPGPIPRRLSTENNDTKNIVVGVAAAAVTTDTVVVAFLHPVLFMFLWKSAEMYMSTTQSSSDARLDSTNESGTTNTSSNLRQTIKVTIAPLPLLEYQYFHQHHQSYEATKNHNQNNDATSCWMVRSTNIVDLPFGSHIYLSCIYVDDEEWTVEWSNPKRMTDEIINISLRGRLIRPQSILALSTLYGCIIARVMKVEVPPPKNEYHETEEVTYQVSTNRDAYTVNMDGPPNTTESPNDDHHRRHGSSRMGTITHPADDDDVVPGYESFSKNLIGLFSFHGSPSAVSGILLVGCAGVGKSRVASQLIHHYRRQMEHDDNDNNNNNKKFKWYYLSVQDLIFQSSVEMNILENVLIPNLRDCNVWILDDLHLLEIPDGAGDEVRRDYEYMMVQNSLIEAIDAFHGQCRILGIAQSETALPSEFTKIGRLEKVIQMLPPTQAQRIGIWRNIFEREGTVPSSMMSKWTLTLATATAGFVASDIHRVYNDAMTRCWARRTQQQQQKASNAFDDDEVQPLLEWTDLREAAKLMVPSQLAELDVLRPATFEMNMSWREIHERSWEDFGGYDAVRKHVFRHVVSPWRHFLERMDDTTTPNDTSDKSWLEPPPGVLFHGPSGTGKTIAATCLAASLELPMIQVRATDILDKWLGGSESLLRSLFARARAASPCILFLDEIDSIASNREEDDTNDFTSRILSTLLNELDGVSSAIRSSRVLVIACTNRIGSLDSALLRPGRLQEHFTLELPSVEDLEDILRLRLQKIPLDPNIELMDLANVLSETGATGADVEGICREVCMISLRRSKSSEMLQVTQDDFDLAIQERFRRTV